MLGVAAHFEHVECPVFVKTHRNRVDHVGLMGSQFEGETFFDFKGGKGICGLRRRNPGELIGINFRLGENGT